MKQGVKAVTEKTRWRKAAVQTATRKEYPKVYVYEDSLGGRGGNVKRANIRVTGTRRGEGAGN